MFKFLLLSSEPFLSYLFLISSICMLLVVNLLLETEFRLFTPFCVFLIMQSSPCVGWFLCDPDLGYLL